VRLMRLSGAALALVAAAACGEAPIQVVDATRRDPTPSKSEAPVVGDTGKRVCPIDVRYAVAEPFERDKARLVIEGSPAVVSAVAGVVTEVESAEETGWARLTIRSSDLTISYRFYLDASRDSLPSEGTAVAAGDVIGGAFEVMDLEVHPLGGASVPPVAQLLDEWGCREGLPKTDVLRGRLLDGSMWEVKLAEPIEVIGGERSSPHGQLEVDGEVVSGISVIGIRPDFTRPDFPGFDPPIMLEEFTLADGRIAQHWNLAPSHENDTYAYVLWIEGPGDHLYLSSGQSFQDAGLIAESIRMDEQGTDIGSVWSASERVAIINLQTYFFLKDPTAPLKFLEVRINTLCRITDRDSSCRKAELEIPINSSGTRDAFEGATFGRVGD
jgi:hypothetical protein